MKLCLVILLVATALAVPVPKTDITRLPTCTETRFVESKRYLYTYESESLTGVVGTSERLSGLKVDCTVRIQVPEQCELILTLEECSLKELDPDVQSLEWTKMQEKSAAFNEEMVKYPLKFTIDGSKITNLEANQAEPLHILNIKKGILSAFQLEQVNSTTSIIVKEETVFGNCTADVKPHYSEDKGRIDYIITKKDLTMCDRPTKNSPFPTLVEMVTNMTLADKLFISDQFCKHDINKRDQVDLIKCEERHVFRPMSYMDAGLQSNITQVLVLQNVEKENSKPKFDSRESRKTNLVYEFENERVPDMNTPEIAFEKLMGLVDSTLDEVKMDTPRQFTEFVAIIRSLSNETIHEFYPMAYNCSEYRTECVENPWKEKLARQYIYDGLSHCITQPCFSLVNTMISKNEVNTLMAQAMLYTMAMQPYPTEVLIHESLRIARALRTQSSILPLSTMVHNYWINNPEIRGERELPEALRDTLAFLKEIINIDCTSQTNELDSGASVESNRQILLALKAIGNIGEPVQTYDNGVFAADDQIISTLFRCAKNPTVPRNISLAAIQAFRRFNIRSAQFTPLQEILLDTNRDVEVRIFTYLMIMRSSPAKRDLKTIIDSMRTEPVDQVRAFIGSHIQNVLETEEPTLQDLREKLFKILSDDPMPEYPKNILKYSQNIEFSKAFRLPYINKTSSSQFDTNIIFNSNGFIPRAAMFNTTLNVLGRSLYMIEFGIDMQGYEETLEAIFGPQGYFPDVLMRNMYTKSKDLMRFLNETYQKKSVEYNLPQTMEKISNKTNDIFANIKPYMEKVMPYITKAMEQGKPILDKAENIVKPIIKKMKSKLNDLETPEPTQTNEALLPEAILTQLDNLHTKVSHMPEPKYLAVYLRAFENELGFATVEEMLAIMPRFNITNIKKINMQMVADLMNEISKKLADGVQLNMTKSIILVQREWVIPTSMGMPMNVSLNGTTAMALRTHFRMKVDDIKKPMFVEGKFAPSIAVEIAGKMGVTLPLYGETGVLANSTIYHSSNIAGNVTYKKGRLQFNLKNIQEPMNLLNFSTNLYLVRPDQVLEYLPGVEQDRSEYKFCTNVSRLVADDLCVSFAYPNASYAYAPRFPLSGPVSFNFTLVPTDNVEAFTLEASLRRERTPTAKKSFTSIGKAAMKPRLLRDIVHFNFSAPGKELVRNISSLLIVDYQKTEVQWNFTIPEVKAFRIYAGLLNLTDSEKNRMGYHLTYNISAAEIYNASTSMTLMSEYTESLTNCSVILSTNIMDWRHNYYAQYLNMSGNWIASLNETYYWDDETPLYKQIMWPFNDYKIKADKFKTAYILVKSQERECSEVDCNRRERVFETSLYRQNLTLTNTHTIKPMSNVNTLNVSFSNDNLVFPIVNFTVQMLNQSVVDTEKYEITLNASRHERYVAAIHDITRIRGEYNHTVRFVYYSVAKVVLPQFDSLIGFPGTFDYYGDALYEMIPSFMNTTITVSLRNETATMEEDIKPLRLLGYLNVTYPNMLNLKEQSSVSFIAKIANDSIYEDNEHSYWGQFNASVPCLKFNSSYLAAVVKGQDGVTVGHNLTVVDQKRMQSWGFDTLATWMPMSSNLTWNTKVATPVLNISYDHVQFKNDGGFQFIFNDTVNNTLNNFLNHTVFGHFELKPEYISLNASLWTKMMQINGSHILRKQGPIVDLSWEAVQIRAKSMYKKALAKQFRALYEETKEVSSKLITSSFNLTNAINMSSPRVGNLTLEHKMGFGIFGLNDTVKVNLTHEEYGLGANLFTNLGMNKTCFHTIFASESKSPLHFMQGNGSFVLFKSAPMEIGLKSASHMAVQSSKSNASLNGTFNIEKMTNLWSFKTVNGSLKYNITSPVIGAQLNSSANLKNFISPFQFEMVDGALRHTINSSVGNLTSEMSVLLDTFSSIFNFNNFTGRMVHIMNSTMANASSVSMMNLDNFSSLSKFVKVNVSTANRLISKKANLTSDAEIVLQNFLSAFNFELVKGLMNHNISTCIGNASSRSLAVLSSSVDRLSLNEANATTVSIVSSKLVNATSEIGLSMQDVKSMFSFRLLNGTMNHTVVSKLANLTSISQVALSESTNIWKFKQLNVTTNNTIAAVLVNASSNMALLMKDFRSMSNFNLVDGNMKHLVNSSIGNFNSSSRLSMVNFTSLFAFEKVNATTKNNFTSRMTNMTSDIALLMKEFRSATNFNLISGNMTNVLSTGYVNGSSNSSVVLSNMTSPLVFDEVNATTSNKLVSNLMNVDSEMLIAFKNFSSLFNFGKVNSSMAHKVLSRWFNATSVSGMVMHNFTSPVTFTEANFTSLNNMTSQVANLTSNACVNFREFTSLFNFRKMAGWMKTNASIKYMNVSSESSALISNHDCLFKFDEFNATTRQYVRSPFTNLTSDVILRLQKFRSIFSFDKVNGTMVHNLTSRFLNATSNSSGIINNHKCLFKFEQMNATTTNIVRSPLTNLTSTILVRLQNFRSIFNFTKIEGNMEHTFSSKWLNATSNSSGLINNHTRLFRFEEINGTTTNNVKSCLASVTSEVVLKMQNFTSIFNFSKVNGSAVHRFNSTLVNVTSNSNVFLNNFTSLFNFSEANTTSLNSVNATLANLTSEMALKVKNIRSIFNFDIISGLSSQHLDSRFVNASMNNSMIINNHKCLFKFAEISAISDNKLTMMSTNLTTVGLVRLENFRSMLSFNKSVISGNFTLASKIFNATTNNTFVVNQNRGLFTFDNITINTDTGVKVLSTNFNSSMFLGLDQFRSLVNFNRIAGASNFSIDSWIVNASSNSSMMMVNHPALFVFDEGNVTTSNKLNLYNMVVMESDVLMKRTLSTSLFNFKKFLTKANIGVTSKLMNVTSNNSMAINEHKCLFEFDGAKVGTLNKLRSSLMNVTSEAVMQFEEFEKIFKFKKVNGTMKQRIITPLINTSSESVIILKDFKSLCSFPEARATTSNNITSRLGNVTTFAGWSRTGSEGFFKFNRMNTTVTMNVSLPVFVVSTEAITDFVNFRNIFNFDKVNGVSSIVWDKCSFMNSTGRAEFMLFDFRKLFDFNKANASVFYNTTSKLGTFTSLTRGGLHDFRAPFKFDRVCMDTQNNLTTPFAAVNQEIGLTMTKSVEFLKFERFNTSSKFNFTNKYVNLTSLERFAIQDMSRLFKFSRINFTRQYNLTSPLVTVNLTDGIEMNDFLCMFKFNRINTTMDYRIATPFTNASFISAVEFNNFTGLLNFDLINVNATVNLSSDIARFDHFSGLAFNNFNGSILKFRLINGTMRNNVTSKLANLTTSSGFTLKNFTSLFNFSNVNAKMSYNFTTPVVNSTLETVMDLFNFSSWRNFSQIETGHNFTVATRMINITTNSSVHMTKWTVYQQRMSANISSPVASIALLQTSDIQSVHFKVASPNHGSLCFLGKISDDGKLMNMSVYHMTAADRLNVTDLQWLLMLNESNVIYSNFSWNPALIDGAFNLTNKLIATTVNLTMTAVNQTRNYTQHVVNVTRIYMNDQIRKINDTYINLDVITAEYMEFIREEIEKAIVKSKEYAVEQWRKAKEYDYDALWLRTVEEYNQLKADLKAKYEELKVRYNDMKVKAIEKYDELKIKFDELVVKIEEIIKNKEHPINRLTMKYFNKSIYEILEISKVSVKKFMEKAALKWAKVEKTLKVLKKKITDFTASLKVKVEEKIEVYKVQLKEKFAELKETMAELKRMYDESDREAFELFVREIAEKLSLKFTELSEKVIEKTKVAIEFVKKLVKDVTEKTKKQVTKALEKAIDRITKMSQDKSNTVNRFTLRLFNNTIYEIAQDILSISKIQYKALLVKLEAYREKAEIFMAKAIEEIIRISLEDENAINKFVIKYMGSNINTVVVEVTEKLVKLITEITEKSIEVYNQAKVDYADYKDKAIEMYNDFDREVFVENVRVFVDKLPSELRNLSDSALVEVEAILEKIMEKLEIVMEEAKVKYDDMVEQVVVMSKNESNAINKLTLKYLNRTVYTIVEELVAIYKEKYAEAMVKLDIYKVKAYEALDKIIDEIVIISLNETHVINKYALKYTGRNANELVKEAIKNFTKLVEQVREKAMELYDDAKVKFVEYRELTIEKYEEYKIKAVELYDEYSVKAIEKYDELRVKLPELYEKLKIEVRNYYDNVRNQTIELKEKLTDLIEKFKTQPLNTSVRETMEYVEEVAEKLKVKVDELTTKVKEFYEENLTEENIMKLREDARQYIEDKVQPIINKLEEFNQDRIQPLVNRLEEMKDEVSKKTWEILENNRVLELTRKFVEKTREYLNATYAINSRAIRSAQEVIRMTREFVEACIEYLNNTMPGWIYRYYEIDQIPRRVWDSAIDAAQMKMEQIPVLIRLTPQLTLNLTRSAINYSLNMSRSAVGYSLNSIGQVGESSFAMNISHPFNYTSFYQPPTLTNKQWEMVDMVQNKTEEVINQVVEYYIITREYINETYPIVVEWVKEQEPFIREKYTQVREQVEILRDQAMDKYEIWKVKAENKYEELKEKVEQVIAETKEVYDEIKKKAELKYDELKVKVEEYYPIAVQECKDAYAIFLREAPNVRQNIKRAYNITIEGMKILQEQVVEKCSQLSEDAVAVYEDLKDKYYELKPRVEKKIDEIIKVVKTKLEKWQKDLKENYKKIVDIIKAELPNWKEHLNKLISNMYEKFDEMIVKALELIEKIKEKIPEITERLEELASRIKDLTPDYIKENLPEIIAYIKKAIKYLEDMIGNFEYPQLPQLPKIPTIRDFIPQFQSTAMIFGPLHVYTFDQKRYEFPGYKGEECSYVLASDFVDRNFTIISTQNSITLVLQEMSIKLNGENKIQINGREEIQELPYQSSGKEVTIVRNGQWVQISTTYGIDIKCDSLYQMCLFNASRWYYNKTLGLLGTLNDEKHFDMRKPDGSVAQTLTEFANAFEISGNKQCKIVPGKDEIFNRGPRDCSEEPSTDCEFYFNDPASPLAECFNTINVAEFKSLCEEETKCYPESSKAICNATTSYVEMCRSHGKQIEHVQQCNKCGDKVIGEVWEITNENTADIVFIVSENKKMEEDHDIAEELTQLVEATEKTLGKANINDNRYALVAFGGEEIHEGPHQHTINGKVFASSSEFINGARSLEFFGDYETDGFKAIEFATELELRAEATKIFVLVSDSETDAEIEEQLTMQSLLADNGITLNVISSYDTLKQEKSSKNIVGINWDGKAIMASKSKKDISTKLDMPRGSYSKVAKASKGAVFSLDQLQREVEDVITLCSKRIRNQVERPLESDLNMKECECKRNVYGRAVSKCEIISE
ncbi:uncharacterized protein [Antedon mediterranea]|uniref:uncharacterized protein n=1 Tax=Antedon mediterranea TaxID=105859 RepID=UPI003AF64570